MGREQRTDLAKRTANQTRTVVYWYWSRSCINNNNIKVYD
jgi:hypothetical protein